MEVRAFGLDFFGEIRMQVLFLGGYGLAAFLGFVFPIILKIDYKSLWKREEAGGVENIKKRKKKRMKYYGNSHNHHSHEPSSNVECINIVC